MTEYFNIIPYKNTYDINDWFNTTSRRVLVLRNPLDRWMSGQRVFGKFLSEEAKVNIWPGRSVDGRTFAEIHSDPVLIQIPLDINFEIIDFNRLSDYIPMSNGTFVTGTKGINSVDIDMTPEMEEEIKRYLYFKSNKPEMSSTEWRELTCS